MIYETPLAISRENITEDMDRILRSWTDATKYVINHVDIPVKLKQGHDPRFNVRGNAPTKVAFTGTDSRLKQWVRDFPHKYGNVYVVTEGDVVYDMDKLRPGLCFYHITVRDGI